MDEISVDVTCQIQGHENKEFCISTSENNTVVGRISLIKTLSCGPYKTEDLGSTHVYSCKK